MGSLPFSPCAPSYSGIEEAIARGSSRGLIPYGIDPCCSWLRSKDRHSSQNTLVGAQGLLQRKHWLIAFSSHCLPIFSPFSTCPRGEFNYFPQIPEYQK